MNAVKLTADPNEKKLLKQRFNVVADVARSVKNNTWTSSHPPKLASGGSSTGTYKATASPYLQSHPKNKTDSVGKWAADVAQSADRTFDRSDVGTTYSIQNTKTGSQVDSHSTQEGIAPSKTSSASNFPASSSFLGKASSDGAHLGTNRETSQTRADLVARGELKTLVGPSTKASNSVSHVRKLREPLSTRRRTTKEEIILLKASRVNGLKCPPWDKIPSADEFALDLTGVYTYVCPSLIPTSQESTPQTGYDVSLSKLTRQSTWQPDTVSSTTTTFHLMGTGSRRYIAAQL